VPIVPEKSEDSEQRRDEDAPTITQAPEEYVSRQAKLPEGGKLDLGSKFVSRPAVVFHSRPAQSGERPPQRGGFSGGPNRPRFSPRPGQPGTPTSSSGFPPRRPGLPGSN